MNFRTMTIMQDMGGRRFAQLSLGTQNVEEVRAEFSKLRTVAAAVCGVENPEELTQEQVAAIDLEKLREFSRGVAT